MLGQGGRIAGYEVEAVIARGGMGVVYRAHQVGLGRSVALKVIGADRAGDPRFRARFVREARLAASLDHPNVIPIFEAGEDQGELFIAMRLVDGADLERLIDRSGPLEPVLACRIVSQAAAGLHAAHLAGLVHRDIKPANILLAGPPEDPHVYVSDFGVAKSTAPAAARLTQASEWVGTPGYAAPEQSRGGAVDARADVYALGCVLLAALTRRAPQPRPALPPAIEAIIDRATAGAPSARFQSARELADALELALRSADGRPGAPAAGTDVGATVGTDPGVDGRPVRPVRAPGDATTEGIGQAPTTAAGRATSTRPRPAATLPGARRRPVADRRWPAWGFGAGFLVIVAVVVGVALARPGAHHPARTRSPARTPARTAAVPTTPAAAGGGDTVLCSAAACTQSGSSVLVPIEGGSCVRDAVNGTWTRLDGGSAAPMLICLPGARLPQTSVPVAVPTLTGARLDHAEAALDQLGIPYRTSGGGLFGIIISSDWTVCATSPSAGAELPMQTKLTVFVEHGC